MALGAQELAAIEQLARRFADHELASCALHDDRYPFVAWNPRGWTSANSLGLSGIALPEAYGGSEQGMWAFARALELIATTDASIGAVVFTQALARAQLAALGPAALAESWGIGSGGQADALLGHPLYDDPDEPSDTVSAERNADGFMLDGELAQLSCLPVATALLVPARLATGGERAFFLVPATAPGVQLSEPVVTLGLRACPLADVRFTRVQISAQQRLGGADAAIQFAAVAERFRPALTALALGVLRGSFELALNYARQRRQAKKQIVEHHMVQEMLGNMLSVLDLGELALPRACALSEQGQATGTELLSLHEYVTTLVTRAATDGVQVLGGNGYMHDYGQEKRMRDAKQLQAVFGSASSRRLRVLERCLLARG